MIIKLQGSKFAAVFVDFFTQRYQRCTIQYGNCRTWNLLVKRERPNESSNERLIERLIDSPIERPIESSIKRLIESSIECPTEGSIECRIEHPIERRVERPIELSIEIESSIECPIARHFSCPIEFPIKRHIERHTHSGCPFGATEFVHRLEIIPQGMVRALLQDSPLKEDTGTLMERSVCYSHDPAIHKQSEREAFKEECLPTHPMHMRTSIAKR